MANELRSKYPEFEAVSASAEKKPILSAGEKKFAELGNYVEPVFADMLSLKMLAGNRSGLKDINSILLSATLARNLFGSETAIDKLIKIDNKTSVKVAGVYEDFRPTAVLKIPVFLRPGICLCR